MKNLLVLLLSLIFLQGCGGGGSAATPLPNCTIEIDGDSVLADIGYGQTAAAYLVSQRSHWIIDDRAVAGLTLEKAATGYSEVYPGATWHPIQPPFVAAPHPSRVVVIELGGNDARSPQTPEEFGDRLSNMIKHLQATHKVTVLTGIVEVETWGAFTAADKAMVAVLNTVTENLAQKLGVPHVGWHNEPASTMDGIHPTPEKRKVLLDKLVATIERSTIGICK